MKKGMLIGTIIIIVVLALIFVLSFKPAHVILESQETGMLNSQISGQLTLSLEPGDSLETSAPLLVSLSKGNSILDVKTLTLENFISLSGKSPSTIEKEGKRFYETPESYSVDTNKIIRYTLNETGEYELLFEILRLDVTVKKTITVN
jgi:hypothetical protein